MELEFESGVFVEECKSRFLCKVNIKDAEELCYVSSSSKLERFIKLQGREVLLIKNTGFGKRTKLTLHALKTREGYILLNLSYVNKLLLEEFSKPDSQYLQGGMLYSEKKLSDKLKADFFIDGEEKIVVEAKGIISETAVAKLPSMKVERAILQLKQFEDLLKKGFQVHYYIVLMSSDIQMLKMDKEYKEFNKVFKSCMKKGMRFFIYRTIWKEKECSVERAWYVEENFKVI